MTADDPCPSCQGVGFTRWSAFVAGLASLIGGWWREPMDPERCARCRGSGGLPRYGLRDVWVREEPEAFDD